MGVQIELLLLKFKALVTLEIIAGIRTKAPNLSTAFINKFLF